MCEKQRHRASKTINMVHEDGLSLGLGYGGEGATTTESKLSSDGHHQKQQDLQFKHCYYEPSLTLGRPSDDSNSVVSSFSNGVNTSAPAAVKRERDDVASEERPAVSSRVSDEDEDVGTGVRKKLRLTKEQSAMLEDSFKEHSTLNPKQKQALAKQLNLRPRQVEVWFQNRRARTKLKQTEMDCEILKRCCENLTDENRRLQKELQELKKIKYAPSSTPPIYMQFPAAATLSVCPSCERMISSTGGSGDNTKAAAPFLIAPKPTHLYGSFTNSPAAC
ncbi:Homeobox-leucine zipper protein HAT22 [Acorus gramineus]|uniref:Homeobox-leucine zipper protein HAT22 n=1 Tax=Acorus gramineus TaxID=55184 RepID=A0AAV9AWF1_ACOGR|nr:Homeobox-leucine zipper protein HAT22 [Acorus gramineus]